MPSASKKRKATQAARSSAREPKRKVIFEPEPQGPSRRQSPSHRTSSTPPPARRRRRTPDTVVPPPPVSSSPRRSSDVSESERDEFDPRNFESPLIYNRHYKSLSSAEKGAFTRKANRQKKRWDDLVRIKAYEKGRNPHNNVNRRRTEDECREEFANRLRNEDELRREHQTIRQEVEERAEQARAEPIKYRVMVSVRDPSTSSGKIFYEGLLGHYTAGEMDTQALDTRVANAVRKGNFKEDSIKITVIVHFATARSFNRSLTIDDFEPDTWKNQIESYIHSEHDRFPRYAIELSVICEGKRIENTEKSTVPSNQRQDTKPDGTSGESSVPTSRKTWTNKFLASNEARDQEREDKATVTKALKEKWICLSSNCDNHAKAGVCWIDKHGVHHQINNHMLLEGWAQSILSDTNCSNERPPQHIKKHIKALTAERQDRKKAGSKKEQERQAAERCEEECRAVEEQRENTRRRQEEAQARMIENVEKMFSTQMTQSQYHMMQSLMGNMSTGFPINPPPLPTPHPQISASAPPTPSVPRAPSAPPTNPPTNERSSPVTENRDEEYEMMEHFWKIWLDSAPLPYRPRIQKAIDIIHDEMWRHTVLQDMSVVGSDVYKMGISKGLPEGFITELRPRIHNFKEVWRNAKALDRFGT